MLVVLIEQVRMKNDKGIGNEVRFVCDKSAMLYTDDFEEYLTKRIEDVGITLMVTFSKG